MRALLILPPFLRPTEIYLSVPALAGALVKHGYDVDQLDLNLETWCKLASTKHLIEGKRFIENRIGSLEQKSCLTLGEMRFYASFRDLVHQADFLIGKLERAAGSEPERLSEVPLPAMTLTLAAKLSMAPAFPERVKWAGEVSYTPAYNPLSSAELKEAAAAEGSFLRGIFDEIVRARLAGARYELIGISCPFPSTIIPALQLVPVLRKHFPDAHVCVGGAAPSCKWRNIEYGELLECMDSLILDDGEIPLVELAGQLRDRRRDFSRVPNLAFKDANGTIVHTAPARTDFIDAAASPDFSRIDFNRYAVEPDRAGKEFEYRYFIPMRLVHGCYWKKCAFCDTALPYISRFRPRSIDAIVDEIKLAVSRTGIRLFYFVDEASPPPLIMRLAERLIEEKIHIEWRTNVRFETPFTEEACRTLYRAGCRMVHGGLEAANDRLLSLMRKGITLGNALDVVSNFSRSGIAVSAFLMVGFPSQTLSEAIESADLVRKLIAEGRLWSGSWHRFFITKGSEVYRRPDAFTVESIRENPLLDLSDACSGWTTPQGMGEDEIESVYSFFSYLMIQWRNGNLLDVPVNEEGYRQFARDMAGGFNRSDRTRRLRSAGAPPRSARPGNAARPPSPGHAGAFDMAEINRILLANPPFQCLAETYDEYERRESASDIRVYRRASDGAHSSPSGAR